ncbi:flagellin [Modestobacter sp. SSW1-42]|uniref:flagellin N-terminal helical domain-containing protein n=1 Tax=Modestobacter sp. SSW1-42 TaxID=596372 RepID=UPI00398574F5
MGLSVNNNIAAMNSYRNLSVTDGQMNKSLEKLSSGFRINRAADDAAGLAISEGLRSQIGGLKVAVRNTQDGISVVQTAEGALTEVHSILQRVRDLAVQAGNDSNNTEARANIKTESDSLVKELGRISASTNFNGTKLLDGSAPELKFQVGADGNADSQIAVNLSGANVKNIAQTLNGGSLTTTGTKFDIASLAAADLTTAAKSFTVEKDGVVTTVTTGVLDDTLGSDTTAGFASVEEFASALRADKAFAANFSVTVNKDANGGGTGITVSALNGGTLTTAANATPGAGLGAGAAGSALSGGLAFDTAENAQASVRMIDGFISQVSTARAGLGALQNRFEHTINNLNVSVENLAASESRIRDTDMAQEMTNFTRTQILTQAGTSMLAQANQAPQGILKLLG